MTPDFPLTTAEAAEYLGVKRSSVNYHVRAKNLTPAIKSGVRFFAKEDLDHFAANRRPQGSQYTTPDPSGQTYTLVEVMAVLGVNRQRVQALDKRLGWRESRGRYNKVKVDLYKAGRDGQEFANV